MIDNSTTPPARQPDIGHYGRLRKAYLEGYRPDLYIALVASEKLYEHCAGIEEAALHRLNIIMPELARRAGAIRELQEKDPLAWVELMKDCREQAEKIIRYGLIYV